MEISILTQERASKLKLYWTRANLRPYNTMAERYLIQLMHDSTTQVHIGIASLQISQFRFILHQQIIQIYFFKLLLRLFQSELLRPLQALQYLAKYSNEPGIQ